MGNPISSIWQRCVVSEVIGTDDIVEVKRIGEPGAHAGVKTRPILVKINSEDKKKRLFENLGRWREVMLNERDPNDKTPFPSIEHDLTVEQRKERNEIVVSAKVEQRNQPEGSHFQIRVRGPPDAMRIVKIDTRTGKKNTLEKK